MNSKGDKNNTSNFPCLVCTCGSMLSYFYYDENGEVEQIGGLENGGQTFLGLAKCLLDTNVWFVFSIYN